MSVQNANKVVFFATKHKSFRASLRDSPKRALKDYADELNLKKDSVTIEELDAIISFTDEDYAAFAKGFESLSPDGDMDDIGKMVFV